MSHELFELFGMLGAGVGLTALLHRGVQPILLRLVPPAAAPMRSASRRRPPGSGADPNVVPPRDAGARPLDSAI